MAKYASTSFTRKCEDKHCLQVPSNHSVTVKLLTCVMSCLHKCSFYTGVCCGVDPVFLGCSILPYISANLAGTTDLLISKNARGTKQVPLSCLAALARNWANGAGVPPCCICHRLGRHRLCRSRNFILPLHMQNVLHMHVDHCR